MKYSYLVLFIFTILLLNTHSIAQTSCQKAEEYSQKVKDANENWTADERMRNNCPQGWSQLGTWHVFKCKCENGFATREEAERTVAKMNQIRSTIRTQYPNCGEIPPVVSIEQCKILSGKTGPGAKGQSGNVDAQSVAPMLQYTGYENKYQRLKDEYIQTFSSGKTYNAYVRGENIKRTGIALAKQLSGGLDQINTEIQSSNPKDILQEFNQKIQQIEQLEASFNQQNNQYSFDAGVQLGNSISSKDWETSFHQLGGIINAGIEAREVRRKMEAKKQALYEERRAKMSDIYWKAVDYNRAQRKEYIRAAAYVRNKNDETYNLAFVDNLDCFLQKMKQNFSINNTYWLKNDCPIPSPKQSNVLNTGRSEDERLIQTAERKYEYYNRYEEEAFRKAAISFASSAIKHKQKPEYFVKLADYYTDYSNLLEYTALLSAQAFSKNTQPKLKKRIERVQNRVTFEVNYAIDNNEIEYLESFLNAGLYETVLIDNNNMLHFAIVQDKPKAALAILNHQNKQKLPKDIRKTLNNALMLCAIENSPNTINALVKNGVSVDIKIKGESPLDVASRLMNKEAFEILLKKSQFKNKEAYRDAPVQLLIEAHKDIDMAAQILDSKNNEKIVEFVSYVLDSDNPKTEYLSLIGKSKKSKLIINSNKLYVNNLKKIFLDEIEKGTSSKAHMVLESGLLSFQSIPKISDLKIEDKQNTKTKAVRPLSYVEEIDLLIESKVFEIKKLENQKPNQGLKQNYAKIEDENIKKRLLESLEATDEEEQRKIDFKKRKAKEQLKKLERMKKK